MIAIICPMDEERDAILKLMSDVKVVCDGTINYHGETVENNYYEGVVSGCDAVVYKCGVGKAYAAMSTQMVINKYNPELVINLGCAGSINEDVHVGDIVIATRTADWDFFVPTWERSITAPNISNACSTKCADIIKQDELPNVHFGPIITGDQFIMKKSQLEVIKEFFPEALAGEMEGNAVATACTTFGIPCCVIRSISDETLVGNNLEQYEFNLLDVCDKAAEICCEIIKRF